MPVGAARSRQGMRAVADTNVLVAAAIAPNGLCGRLLLEAVADRWQLVVSPALMTELGDVLERPKFRRWLSTVEATRFAVGVGGLAEVVADPASSAVRRTPDPDDEFLIALARAAGVAALISGDAHLTAVVGLVPPVLTPAAFLAQIVA